MNKLLSESATVESAASQIDGNRWEAIISPDHPLAGIAWKTAREIADAVRSSNFEQASGKNYRHSDIALLMGYWSLTEPLNAKWSEALDRELSIAIDEASNRNSRQIGLYGGLCGLGWVVEHLLDRLGGATGGDSDSSDPNEDIDRAVIAQMKSRNWLGLYDLISGLVGFGVYFLERLPSTVAEEALVFIVRQLETISETIDNGIAWFTPPQLLPGWQREIHPSGYYNLGVAHGIPGILHFLSEAAFRGIERDRAQRLLEGGMKWFLAQERAPGAKSRFSCWSGKEAAGDSRPTWCYGDLGILSVILQIARRNGREDWHRFGRKLLDDCLAWPPAETGLIDAPLCHGFAGSAHIFNRLYQTEGDRRCLDTALRFIEMTLAAQRPGIGVAGYQTYTRPDPIGPAVWESSPAFLDGATGISLALLAALTPIAPQWDRLLQISGR